MSASLRTGDLNPLLQLVQNRTKQRRIASLKQWDCHKIKLKLMQCSQAAKLTIKLKEND